MAPNPAPKVCPDTKGMVFTHYCITIAIFSENALSSKNAFQGRMVPKTYGSRSIVAKIADVGPPEKIYDSKSCDTLMYFQFVI